MSRFIIRLCCTIIGLFCLTVMIYGLIDGWAESSLSHKIITILAILGWVDINYDIITLKYNWLRRILGITNDE